MFSFLKVSSTMSRAFCSSCMCLNSTVYALSSGSGKCGVAVIRVSGPQSNVAMMSLTAREKLPTARRLVLRRLYDPVGGHAVDRALVVWLPAPDTFTGEDCCEFHTHGGPAVVSAVLHALSSVPGLAPAQPGQFTRRAFFNDKLDMTQVEGLADLIHAETEAQRKQALRQMEGDLSRLYSEWRSQLVSLMASAEAVIDFAEEDQIGDDVLQRVIGGASRLQEQISDHLRDARRGQRMRDGVRVCIAGAVNAGKSSLLNRLVQRQVSIVSSQAGTTRDVLESTIDVDGLPLMFSDTAGLRDSEDSVEREGVRRARETVASSDLVLVVMDVSVLLARDPLISNSAAVSACVQCEVQQLGLSLDQCVLVLNKVDLLSGDTENNLRSWSAHRQNVCLLSCTSGRGVSSLMKLLTERARLLCVSQTAAPTRHRHVHHLTRACDALSRFTHDNHADLALCTHQLRLALQHVGHVTGHVSTEHVLDVLFADFCIGK